MGMDWPHALLVGLVLGGVGFICNLVADIVRGRPSREGASLASRDTRDHDDVVATRAAVARIEADLANHKDQVAAVKDQIISAVWEAARERERR